MFFSLLKPASDAQLTSNLFIFIFDYATIATIATSTITVGYRFPSVFQKKVSET